MEDNKALGVLGIIVSLAWCANCLIAVYLIMQVCLHCLIIIDHCFGYCEIQIILFFCFLDGKFLDIVIEANRKERRGPAE